MLLNPSVSFSAQSCLGKQQKWLLHGWEPWRRWWQWQSLEGVSVWHLFESVVQVMQPFLHLFYCLHVCGRELNNPPANGLTFLEEINPQALRDFSRILFIDHLLVCLIPFPLQGNLKTVRSHFQLKGGRDWGVGGRVGCTGDLLAAPLHWPCLPIPCLWTTKC